MKRVIVRNTDRVAGLSAGDTGKIDASGISGLIRFVPDTPPVIARWAFPDMFLNRSAFLKPRRKLDRFWTLCFKRTSISRKFLFVAHPHAKSDDAVAGTSPFPFESLGEAVYWCRLRGFEPHEFIVGVNIPWTT